MVPIEQMKRLIGHVFPGGEVTIEASESRLLWQAALAPPMPPGAVHPIFGFLAPIAGMGLTWDEMFALCHAKATDGPLMGALDIAFDRPLQTGRRYRVRGEITAVDRKQGRRAGTFDVVAFRLELMDGDDRVASFAQSLILPRRA